MTSRFWCVVPAAGSGSRMGGPVPKQYLSLDGRPLIEHSVRRVAAHPRIEGVVVAVSAHDPRWEALHWDLGKPVWRAEGGAERCDSVTNALETLAAHAAPEDWVLVHDAARPCVRTADIDRLIRELETHTCGGLLGVPVKDTMKRVDAAGAVDHTVDRRDLWHALTPQMFRLGQLHDALRQAVQAGVMVTDEASAMEYVGCAPRMVEGHPDNIKVTRREDLALAGYFLQAQGAETGEHP